MHFTLSILVSVLASTLVAPAPALDAATLLKNGQVAQKLNAQFEGLKATNSCQSGETACIGNAIATCNNGRFDTSRGLCEKTQSCFALPNVRANGTTLRCTSENSAFSLINVTGATGGITGDDNTDSNEGSNSSAGESTGKMDQNPGNFTSVASATATEAPDIVTVTVTLTATAAPVTVEASTETLSPEQASSLLFSILGQAIPTPDSSNSTPSAAVATSPPVIATSSAASGSDAPSSIIQLTTVQVTESLPLSSSFTQSSASVSVPPTSIVQLTAAQVTESVVPFSSPAAAAAVVTSAVSSPSSGYDSGSYGGC